MNHNRFPKGVTVSNASIVIAVIGIIIAGAIALNVAKKKK